MFPRAFEAQIAQRLVVWGAMLGFLFALYAGVELVQASKMREMAGHMEQAATTVAAYADAEAAFARVATFDPRHRERHAFISDLETVRSSLVDHAGHMRDPQARVLADDAVGLIDQLTNGRAGGEAHVRSVNLLAAKRGELGKMLASGLQHNHAQHKALLASDSKNKLLIALLAIFVIGEVLFLEYRWLVRPMVRMASVLRKGDPSSRLLAADSFRRDEIGALARALGSHLGMVRKEQQAARDERELLSGRLERQEQLKRESLAFQNRIAEVVQRLEDHAGRMSAASDNLVSIASDADTHAKASAESTGRVSGHVDVVASSIGDIAQTLTTVAGEAERTSEVAATARGLVQAASDDAHALTEAARTIEQVIALIHEVANQTNLLALNATIEAARAGEMGRGFAVVAAEVKQLATRTARATEEIRGGLQGITSASVRIAERVARLVESIEEVDTVAATIATSIREQDSNSRTITSNTANTAEDVRKFAETFQRVAGLVGDAKQAAQLVTKVSSDLGQQATDLRSAVDRFVATTQRIAA